MAIANCMLLAIAGGMAKLEVKSILMTASPYSIIGPGNAARYYGRLQNLRGLSQICRVFAANWDCPFSQQVLKPVPAISPIDRAGGTPFAQPAQPNSAARMTLIAEIISIGDELASGERLDTNSQWLSQRLGELGVSVVYHTTVADDLAANVEVFRLALDRRGPGGGDRRFGSHGR